MQHTSTQIDRKTTAEHTSGSRAGLMQAAVLREYGSPEKLVSAEVPRPSYGDDQVLVRVHAAGINPVDWRIRNGSLRLILPAKFPVILGFDVAGRIVEAGHKARQEGWNAGDEVLGFLEDRHGGGYAEYAAARVIARKPAGISFEEAAGVPLAASTALQALRDIGELSAGKEVLVNGASGGVGTFAVQLGKEMGARVTGVCSERNLDFVRELGADHVINYAKEDFTHQECRYDVVFDAVAKSSYPQCRGILKPHGTYITTVASAKSILFQMLTSIGGRRCRNMLVRPRSGDLQYLAERLEQGRLRSVIQRAYPLGEVASAHRLSEEGHVRGKLVLSVPT